MNATLQTDKVNRYSAPPAPNLRQFTLDFFSFFDASVQKLDRRKNGLLQVDLPGSLQEYFETNSLRLCFEHSERDEGCELVAYGSLMFDRMMEYLENRGASTLLVLPRRHNSSEELMQAIRPRNASIIDLQMGEARRNMYVLNWRLTFRSDEVYEEIFTVALDHDGRRVTFDQPSDMSAEAYSLESLFNDGEYAIVSYDGEDLDTNGQDSHEHLPISQKVANSQLDAKMPPMTHLVSMAEVARKYAVYHADLLCASQESEILPRLYRTLNRITTYYGQQIEEVYDTHDRTGEKRRVLEEDLQRKIAEEVENHRLHVRVELISYAVIQTPVALSKMTVADGHNEAQIEVELDRYSGAIHRPHCQACGEQVIDLVLDKNGHITCDSCIRQCATCGEIVCADCGVEPCPVCGKENCADCGEMCWACGERACPDHIESCPVCGDRVCLSCQEVCSHCGVRQCRSHLVADAVVNDEGEYELICEACAVRCRGCQQYSAHMGVCAASGQQFCQNCLMTCSQCGKQIGPGFYHELEDGRVFCNSCMVECPTCGRLTHETYRCERCGVEYCDVCGLKCDVCDAHCCEGHCERFEQCGHAVCEEHMVVCAGGGEPICAVCSDSCGICEMPYCETHSAVCRHCGQTYCSNCVSAAGLCATCESMASGSSVPVDLKAEACSADLEVASMARHYNWVRGGNQRYIIYDGRNRLMGGAVVVVDLTGGADNVVIVRRIGLLESVRERIHRVNE